MALHLDPRCKLYLLLIGNLLLFFHVSTRAQILLMAIVLSLFFLSGRARSGVKLTLTYLAVLAADQWLVPVADGLVLNWISMLAVTVRLMLPCLVTGSYAFTTTSVSEFVCAMRRMKVPEAIVIPCMVVIRFFPTIKEDFYQIRCAMALRGIGGGTLGLLRHPMQSLEYILIPLLMNSNNVAQDLSVAALTKGIGLPGEHTSMVRLHFGAADAVVMILCTLPVLASIGGVL